jgi:transposase
MTIQRKQYSARDKIELLRQHLDEHVPVPTICEQHDIHPTVYYRWQRQLFSRGHVLFHRRSPARLAAKYRKQVRELKTLARSREKELERLRRQLLRFENPNAAQHGQAVAYSLPHPRAVVSMNSNEVSSSDEFNSSPCGTSAGEAGTLAQG